MDKRSLIDQPVDERRAPRRVKQVEECPGRHMLKFDLGNIVLDTSATRRSSTGNPEVGRGARRRRGRSTSASGH